MSAMFIELRTERIVGSGFSVPGLPFTKGFPFPQTEFSSQMITN